MGLLASSLARASSISSAFSLGVAEKHFISSTNPNHNQIPSKVESTASLDLNTYLLQIKTLGLGFIKGVFSDIC